MPHHKHHCAACIYLGADTPVTPAEKAVQKYVDMYYHQGWRIGLGTFSRRWGSEPTEYVEVPITYAEGVQWDHVRSTAIKKSLLPP